MPQDYRTKIKQAHQLKESYQGYSIIPFQNTIMSIETIHLNYE